MMIYAVISLGLLGAAASFGLGIAAKKFSVDVDPKVEEINEVLPQANCGGCGYAGCSNYAEAVVKGEIGPDKCVAGGDDITAKVASVIGVKAEAGVKRVAYVKCSGTKEVCENKFDYSGFKDCVGAQLIGGGYKGCAYGCLRLGTCESACPFDAIKVEEDGLPVVNEDKCTGCGNCVKACPRNILELVETDKKVRVFCNSKDKGAAVRKVCSAGCIACGKCEKICPVNAVAVKDNLAVIDFKKCINCGLCANVCPQDVIHELFEDDKPKATILEEPCVGCGLCKKVCPVNAISGNVKEVHSVDKDKCIGCGLCVEKCRKNAIVI
jgi:Na+-translocating ferredoxin:NAD+ oxidoreductase RNF subunit RnfB